MSIQTIQTMPNVQMNDLNITDANWNVESLKTKKQNLTCINPITSQCARLGPIYTS
jgi:hypothetical protein